MKRKKDIVQDALLTAKELETAAKSNAQDVIIEAFAPRLIDLVRQTISEEGPGPQLASPVTALAKSEEENDEADGKLGNEDAAPEAIAPTPATSAEPLSTSLGGARQSLRIGPRTQWAWAGWRQPSTSTSFETSPRP